MTRSRKKSSDMSIVYAIVTITIICGVYNAFYSLLEYLESLDQTLVNGAFFGIITLGIAFIYFKYKKNKTKLIDKTTSIKRLGIIASDIDGIMQRDGYDFEHITANMLTNIRGYQCRVTKQSGDGGKDIVAKDKNNKIIYVECKRYTGTIPVEKVQKLHSAMVIDGVSKGIFVTTSKYSKPSIEYAKRAGIELIDGNVVSQWAKKVKHF